MLKFAAKRGFIHKATKCREREQASDPPPGWQGVQSTDGMKTKAAGGLGVQSVGKGDWKKVGYGHCAQE